MKKLEMFKDFNIQWLAPLMVYFAAGLGGLTGLSGTFLIKEKFGFDAEFLITVGFWAGLPWTIKISVGHIVDLFWKYRGWVIVFAAGLMGLSLFTMAQLATNPSSAPAFLGLQGTYLICSVVIPLCYMIQDAVADGMTVDSVEKSMNENASEDEKNKAHESLQALGRLAIVSGGIAVGIINIIFFSNTEDLPKEQLIDLYIKIYWYSLGIPVISIIGVLINLFGKKIEDHKEKTKMNLNLLLGSFVLASFAILSGVINFKFAKETVFLFSFIVLFYLAKMLSKDLTREQKITLVCTGMCIFVYRSMPSVGPGLNWWMIDVLKFDPGFLAKLGFIGSIVALTSIFFYRTFFSKLSIYKIISILTIIGTILFIPTLAMWHGLHIWLEQVSGGLLGAKFIALVDETLASPITELAMIPMLAWISQTAPYEHKAAWFATLASLSNIALSLARIITNWMNQTWVVTGGKMVDGQWVVGNYENLGYLLWTTTIIGFATPLLAAWICSNYEKKHVSK